MTDTMGATTSCRSCAAPVVRAALADGRRLDLDLEATPDGDVERLGRSTRQPDGARLPLVRIVAPQAGMFDDGPARWLRHDCGHLDDLGRRVDPAEVGGATSGARHPGTSRHAARIVRRGTQHAAILADLLRAGAYGATAHELATGDTVVSRRRPGITPNQIGSRFAELRDRGFVGVALDGNADEITRQAAAGPARVHVLTGAGRLEAGRLAEATR